MAFWSDAYTEAEPKRQFRWILLLGGIPQWIIKKVNKPSFDISEAEHSYLNHTFYYPGRVKYEPISITLVDPLEPDASLTMMQLLEASGYAVPENQDDLQTISKHNATFALGQPTIQQLGPSGDVADSFTLKNAWVQKVSFGELDYTSDDMIEITMDIRYDYLEFSTHGSSVENPPPFASI